MLIDGFWAMLVLLLGTYALVWAGERGGKLPVVASGLLGLGSVVGWVWAVGVSGQVVP